MKVFTLIWLSLAVIFGIFPIFYTWYLTIQNEMYHKTYDLLLLIPQQDKENLPMWCGIIILLALGCSYSIVRLFVSLIKTNNYGN